MDYIVGVDIGNSSTEVALAQCMTDGQLHFVASTLTETTGIKGTQRNIFGINKALNLLVEKAGIALSDISLIRINEATPVLGINHAIAHQLGGQFHIAHGLANALLLVPVIRFNAADARARKRYARLAKLCHFSPANGDDGAAVNQLIHQIELLKRQCGLAQPLAAMKVDERQLQQRIPDMITAAQADVTLRTNPRPADDNDIRGIIEALYE
ncbi:hypothetical protein LC20_02023 [Yersinia hibernica]|uniref:Fe-containing alcohol dehydrogenase-like C-terminal domain-containing protein n=1 Tax=Yersinia enterocolitica LC20 TaxID=1443113 RepID=A0A7U4K0Z6_YEREN|nr:hypothetical protein LC20_02023 [Yersinia hibernica]